MYRRRFVKVSGIVLTATISGCINQQNNNQNTNQTQNIDDTTRSNQNQNQTVINPKLSVQNQIINGSEIKIDEINIDKNGWIIIHPEINNQTQDTNIIYGYRELKRGNYTDIILNLSKTLTENQTVYASLHYNDTLDNPKNITSNNKPITINGNPLRKPIDISIKQKNQNENQKNQEKTVILEDTSFNPIRLNINPRDTVIWRNEDRRSYGHTIKSAKFHDSATDWSFESETLGTGDQIRYTFTEPGIYQYYCTIHGENEMCGTILVGDVSLNQILPCET